MRSRRRIAPARCQTALRIPSAYSKARCFDIDNARSGSKGNIATDLADVGFTPKNEHPETIVACPFCAMNGSRPTLFDHLVGSRKERRREIEADALSSLEINHKLEVSGLFERQVGCARAEKNANHEIAHSSAGFG
jgi:hypothetical protein